MEIELESQPLQHKNIKYNHKIATKKQESSSDESEELLTAKIAKKKSEIGRFKYSDVGDRVRPVDMYISFITSLMVIAPSIAYLGVV
jgi:hypothetical protein